MAPSADLHRRATLAGRPPRRIAALWASIGLCATLALGLGAGARSASAAWHLDASFGKGGVAGLPVRERGVESPYPPGPGARGSLLAAGPSGSLYVAGFAHSRRGELLIARLSARGRLVRGFARGGVLVAPDLYCTPEHPPRLLPRADGGLTVVGLDRSHRLVVLAISASGRLERGFAAGGVARYALAGAQGTAMLAGATTERGGDVLVAYYEREVPQPVNEPAIAPGLPAGGLRLARLAPSGALDPSFGHGGFLTTSARPAATAGEGFAAGLALGGEGGIVLAYEQVASTTPPLQELPAVQELAPDGTPVGGFGQAGVAFLPFVPVVNGQGSLFVYGLFALGGGGVEVSFGGAQLFRFAASGAPDASFGAGGATTARAVTMALALAPDGETFSLQGTRPLKLGGTLVDGAAEPALGGGAGRSFPAKLPSRRGGEEQQAIELLASGPRELDVLVGEQVVRLLD